MASKGDTCSLSHFFLIMLPTRNFKLPFVLQICEILISKTWLSPTHHLTFKKKKKKLNSSLHSRTCTYNKAFVLQRKTSFSTESASRSQGNWHPKANINTKACVKISKLASLMGLEVTGLWGQSPDWGHFPCDFWKWKKLPGLQLRPCRQALCPWQAGYSSRRDHSFHHSADS